MIWQTSSTEILDEGHTVPRTYKPKHHTDVHVIWAEGGIEKTK